MTKTEWLIILAILGILAAITYSNVIPNVIGLFCHSSGTEADTSGNITIDKVPQYEPESIYYQRKCAPNESDTPPWSPSFNPIKCDLISPSRDQHIEDVYWNPYERTWDIGVKGTEEINTDRTGVFLQWKQLYYEFLEEEYNNCCFRCR